VHRFADLIFTAGGWGTQAYQRQQFAPDRHVGDYIRTYVLFQKGVGRFVRMDGPAPLHKENSEMFSFAIGRGDAGVKK
jgi:hypothetical protein